jgi:phosphohistidine phosphatase
MNKTLHLIRHSKATREFSQINDIDRPLTERGCHDAQKMSVSFQESFPQLDLILTSPSVRTFSTALIFARTLSYPVNDIKIDRKIYQAGSRDLLSVINHLDNKYSSVMLFAHNPGISRLLNILVGMDNGQFATSAFAIVHFDLDQWAAISAGTGKLLSYRQPRENIYT